MLDDNHIPTLEEAKKHFRSQGIKEEVAIKWWNRQEQYHWISKYTHSQSAQRWIDNATPDERLPPERHWKPFGNTLEVQRICAHDALLRERSCPGTYTQSELRDIHEFLNTTQSH